MKTELPTTAARRALRRTSVGIVAVAMLAGGGLTACKDPIGTGAQPRPSVSPESGKPTTGGSSGTGTAPSGSKSASASASTKPTSNPTTKNPTGGGPVNSAGGNCPKLTELPKTYTSGWPAAHNTGYPQGLAGDTRKKVTLTPYTGPMTITVAGTVIDGKDINGALRIKAKNVTIRNSRIRVANVQAVSSLDDDYANLRIEDTEIDGQKRDASKGGIALIGNTGYTLLRVNAHGSGDILRMDGNAMVQDSWLHDPGGTGSDHHNDIIQSTNAICLRILHNRMDNPFTQTSCILLKADIGSIGNVIVDGNLMNGGGYSFYWYDSGHRITNGKVTNNKFMRKAGGGFWPKGGHHGTQAIQASQMPQWSNNTWLDNNQEIGM